MVRKSCQVVFTVKDPINPEIRWVHQEFKTIPDFHRFLKSKGFTDSYTKIYKWVVGQGARPVWYNQLIYEVEVFSGGGVEALNLELKLRETEEEDDDTTGMDAVEASSVFQ